MTYTDKTGLINVLKIPKGVAAMLCDPLPVIRDKGAHHGISRVLTLPFPAKVFSQASSRM